MKERLPSFLILQITTGSSSVWEVTCSQSHSFWQQPSQDYKEELPVFLLQAINLYWTLIDYVDKIYVNIKNTGNGNCTDTLKRKTLVSKQ